MEAKFKEKSFEHAFMGELRLRTAFLFAPDQCDEHLLGFDGAVFLPWEDYPPFLPFICGSRRRRRLGISASEIGEFGQELNARLPPFRLNVFIQFKRNHFLTQSHATEWESWKRSYFRYPIEEHQQQLMHKIAVVAQGRAASVYAAAAFYENSELFRHQTAETIIENSNVASASLLNGHKCFTYIDPGNFGIAHSTPEDIESPSFDEVIAASTRADQINFTTHMKDTAAFLMEVVQDDSDRMETLSLAKKALTGGDMSEIYPRAEGSWMDAILTIMAFSLAFNIRTCAIA